MTVKGRWDEPHFRVPNSVFDNHERIDMNIYEMMIFIYLCRCSNNGAKAYPGYGRIAKCCKMSRRQAINAISGLEKKGYIKVKRRANSMGDHDSNLYQVNVDSVSLAPASATHALGVVQDMHPGGASSAPNKELTIKKSGERQLSSVEKIISLYKELFNKQLGFKPRISTKDKQTVGDIVDQYGVDKTAKVLRLFFDKADEFTRKKGYPIGLFASNINSLLIAQRESNKVLPYHRKFESKSKVLPEESKKLAKQLTSCL